MEMHNEKKAKSTNVQKMGLFAFSLVLVSIKNESFGIGEVIVQ